MFDLLVCGWGADISSCSNIGRFPDVERGTPESTSDVIGAGVRRHAIDAKTISPPRYRNVSPETEFTHTRH
jgi:hypothetical protein